MNISLNLSKKSFAVYGLGSTGQSVINFFIKASFKNYVFWDDEAILRKKWKLNEKKRRHFVKALNLVDFIIVSPGINPKKTKLKKILSKNKSKIISDLDLFYMVNSKIRSIVVTGTNGKSTTCKILEHVLKRNKINTILGGNIGKPVLSLNLKRRPLVIIEASSFQLAYSKFVKPDYAMILNITNDHLDWHGSMKNYISSKFKIFSLQNKNNFAFLNDKKFIKEYKRRKFKGRLIFVNNKHYKKIRNKIKNSYLSFGANERNMSFIFAVSKVLKIREEYLIRSLKSFKGLPHRHEIFLRKNNKIFINDSKATSFEASKFALAGNRNIFWIVGGMPKVGDKFKLGELKNNIMKSYIIGNYMKNFQKFISGKVDFILSKTLNAAIKSIFQDIKNIDDKKITILLSPASASYDQFKNFEERGNQFKIFIKNYAKKYL